jgi:hypothetical protein
LREGLRNISFVPRKETIKVLWYVKPVLSFVTAVSDHDSCHVLSFSSVTTKILFNGKIVLSIGFDVKLNNVPVLC